MAYDDEDYEPEDPGLPPPIPPDETGVIYPGGGTAPPPASTPVTAAGGGGHGGHGGAPDTGPTYSWPTLPGFIPPTFDRPTMETALAEPGYQFRLGAGQSALERSAAARGVLRSGGTLQNLLEYGQKFGAQEYSNVFNRALQEYDRKYQGAKDAYAPRLAQWQTMAGGEIQRALALYAQKHRGGGGGGGSYVPPDVLGPPPTPPDWATTMSMGGTPAYTVPPPAGGGFSGMDELDPYQY